MKITLEWMNEVQMYLTAKTINRVSQIWHCIYWTNRSLLKPTMTAYCDNKWLSDNNHRPSSKLNLRQTLTTIIIASYYKKRGFLKLKQKWLKNSRAIKTKDKIADLSMLFCKYSVMQLYYRQQIKCSHSGVNTDNK